MSQFQTYSNAGGPALRTGWGWVLVYGILVFLVGLFALANPLATGLATGLLLGVLLIAYGVFAIVAGLSPLATRSRWTEILLGVVAILVGILILADPFTGALSLVWAIGFWLVLSGIFQAATAARAAYDRGWRLFLGLVDIVLGVILLFSGPATSLAFLAAMVGISFLFRGIFLIILSFGLRRLSRG